MINTNFYFGVVEDRKDPLMLGRVRVRVLGIHNPNTVELPTTDLPWAVPVTPVTTAGISGIGHSPTGPVEGTWCLLIFRDKEMQQPMILGTFAGIPISGATSQSMQEEMMAGAIQDNQPVFMDHSAPNNGPKLDPITDPIGQPVTPTPDSPKVDALRGNTNAEKAYNFFIDKGYTPAAAAGITGNLMQESYHSINPTAIGDGGKSFGIVQWNGARRTGLMRYAESSGQSAYDLKTQLEYLDIEARGKDTPYAGSRNGGGLYRALENETDPARAAVKVSSLYERCGACADHNRIKLANQVAAANGVGIGTADTSTIASSMNPTDKGLGYPIPSAGGSSGSSNVGFKDPFNVYPRYTLEADTNRLARSRNLPQTALQSKLVQTTTGMPFANIKGKERTWGQPTSPYNARYPYNHVYQSESGHIMEFDDTKGAERINIQHRSGTFTEIDLNGTQVNKIVGNGYTIYDNDGYIAVTGNCIVAVGKDVSIVVNGNAQLEIMGETNLHAAGAVNVLCDKQISIETPKDIDIKCKDFNLTCNQVNYKLDSSFEIKAGSLIAGDAPRVAWNSGAANPTEAEPQFNYFSPKLKELQSSSYEAEAAAAANETYLDIYADGSSGGSAGTGVPNGSYNDAGELITREESMPTSRVKPKSTSLDPNAKIDNSMQMSKNSTLNDWVKSKGGGGYVRAQHGRTEEEIVSNMKNVAENVYEPIKEMYPEATITSGFRYDGNYAAQGGGKISQHEVGEAVDISFPGYTDEQIFEVAKNLRDKIPYDQLIYEQTNSGTILHVSLKQNAEPQYRENHLVYVNNQPTYPRGLVMRTKT